MAENGNGEETLLVSAATEDLLHNGEREHNEVGKEGKQVHIEGVSKEHEAEGGYKIGHKLEGETTEKENGKEPDVQEQEEKEVEEEKEEKEVENEKEEQEDGVQDNDCGDRDGEVEHIGEEEIGEGGKIFDILGNKDLKEGDGTTEQDDLESEPAKKKVKGLEPVADEV